MVDAYDEILNERKQFAELTQEEVNEMWLRCVHAAGAYAKSINMGGLSHLGSHDIYTALRKAIHDEWQAAKRSKARGLHTAE